MYPTNERPDRKKSRARVRPPAAGSLDPVTEEQATTPAGHETQFADPVSPYPSAAGLSEQTSYPPSGAYGVPPTTYPAAGPFAEPAATYPTTSPYGEPPTTYQGHTAIGYESTVDAERTLELREEQLVARKELREVGEITVRTVIEEIPGRLEVEAQREEVEIEHVPMGQVVAERVGPYEEDGVLVVPIYEEQLVVVKRLVLKEHLRVRRVASTEHQLFEDTLRRDRLVVEDPNNTRLVHEQYATDGDHPDRDRPERAEHDEGGPLGQLMRKVLG
jgi:uncharacterized protein (TIGR02271 family)